jgi:ATP-binding cassette subfamily B protein
VSFAIAPHESIAFVGENGSGKTTLVKLLTRLYDPTEGRILLDGVDLREYDLSALRRAIGVIFQDFFRYDLTARDNIAVGWVEGRDDVPRIVESAEKSLASDVIEALDGKYDQMLGRRFEGGADLSGGEWQKVALGRAYMRDAQVLVLDEPTAALDARAEYEVFRRFSELTRGRWRCSSAIASRRCAWRTELSCSKRGGWWRTEVMPSCSGATGNTRSSSTCRRKGIASLSATISKRYLLALDLTRKWS